MASLINGTEHGFSSIIVNVLGVPLVGIVGISYDSKKDIQNIYGAGSRPIARGHGNEEFVGSITLKGSELVRLEAVAPDGKLYNIPEFDIPIVYLPEGGPVVTHRLEDVRFLNNGRELNQGDLSSDVEIQLVIGNINYNA